MNLKKADRVFQDFRSWPADRVTTAAFWWERSVRLGREAGRALPPGLYCEVLYEALVADPWKECQRLCEFLNVPRDDAMLRFHEGRTRAEQGLSSKRKWLRPTSGLRDLRAQMTSAGVKLFEALARRSRAGWEGELRGRRSRVASRLDPLPSLEIR